MGDNDDIKRREDELNALKAKQKAEQRVEMDRLALGRLAIASGAIDNFLATDAVPVFATSLSEIETRLNKDTRLQVDIDKNVVAEKGTVAAMIKSADLDDGKPRKVYEKTDSYRYKGETHGKTYDLNVEAHEYLISGEVRGVRRGTSGLDNHGRAVHGQGRTVRCAAEGRRHCWKTIDR